MTRLVFGVLCGLTLLMCRPVLAADSVFREYPDEWYLQRQVFRNGSPNSVWRADAISNAVQTISRRLERGVGLPAQFAEVTVTTCSEERAAVYAGGWVEVCLPLMLNAETEDEVAFVIGHEISHIIADHLPQNPNDFYQAKRRGRSACRRTWSAHGRGCRLLSGWCFLILRQDRYRRPCGTTCNCWPTGRTGRVRRARVRRGERYARIFVVLCRAGLCADRWPANISPKWRRYLPTLSRW